MYFVTSSEFDNSLQSDPLTELSIDKWSNGASYSCLEIYWCLDLIDSKEQNSFSDSLSSCFGF